MGSSISKLNTDILLGKAESLTKGCRFRHRSHGVGLVEEWTVKDIYNGGVLATIGQFDYFFLLGDINSDSAFKIIYRPRKKKYFFF